MAKDNTNIIIIGELDGYIADGRIVKITDDQMRLLEWLDNCGFLASTWRCFSEDADEV